MVSDPNSNDDSSSRRVFDGAATPSDGVAFSDEVTNPGIQFDDSVTDSSATLAGLTLKNIIMAVPMFAGFPEKMVNELQKAATIIHFDPEQPILKQGEINKNLYFLVLGTVDIYVDGGLVASLRRKGDLLGEMSVITSKPCSATIMAQTPVELICVNTDEFKKVLGNNQDQYDHILYRIYSQTLTDKVNITNQRAKKVEGMLQALERAKSELIEINAQMERRVVERTQAIQTKLQELSSTHLDVLGKSLKEAAAKSAGEIKAVLETGLHKVEDVVHFLEPMIQMFNLEVSMKTRRVLLAQGERKAQTIAKMALGGTGMTIVATASIDEAKGNIATEKYDVVLVDGESLHLIETLQALKPAPKIVYVVSKDLKESLPKLLELKNVPNLVLVREADRAGSIRTIMTTVTKLCSPNLFGLEKYLNVGVEVQQVKITNSLERQIMNSQMREHFAKLGIRSSILDSVSLVLEEMLMNAIYDAPTDATGVALYNKLDRKVQVNLKPLEQGQFRFATDGTLLAISVQDPFGSLTAKTIMNYLDSCYGGREGTLQEGKGGAGRGLHQIIESSTFVVFNVQPKRQTEVIAFFDVVPGPKEAHSPMLHYFVS